jgi:hypothetical protein
MRATPHIHPAGVFARFIHCDLRSNHCHDWISIVRIRVTLICAGYALACNHLCKFILLTSGRSISQTHDASNSYTRTILVVTHGLAQSPFKLYYYAICTSNRSLHIILNTLTSVFHPRKPIIRKVYPHSRKRHQLIKSNGNMTTDLSLSSFLLLANGMITVNIITYTSRKYINGYQWSCGVTILYEAMYFPLKSRSRIFLDFSIKI